MTEFDNELQQWLAGGDLLAQPFPAADDWIAGFDPDRQAVVLKAGPFKRLYLRPQQFSKRFYHQLYPLTIENWSYRRQLQLFDNFCCIDLLLDLRFQATLAYVQKHEELLANINQHIRQTYADLLDEIVNRELQHLSDRVWVQNGLTNIEKRIAAGVCELLTLQQIQAQAQCKITASFADFPSVEPGQHNVYLHVLKKTYEINEQKQIETERQQRLLEQQQILEKQRRLEHLQELTRVEIQEQALESEKKRRLLEEQEDLLALQLAIEKRIHAQQISHDAQLKEMLLDSELRIQEQHQGKQRLAEIRQFNEQLAHEAKMEAMKIRAQIQRREKALIDTESDSLPNT